MKIFLDSSDISAIKEFEPKVDGFTTNPTLMRKAGVTDYEKFCKEVLTVVNGKPVSFEVFADEFPEMERQARIISSWGENIYIKIPVTTTKGVNLWGVIQELLEEKIKVNITAVTNLSQLFHLFSLFRLGVNNSTISSQSSLYAVSGNFSICSLISLIITDLLLSVRRFSLSRKKSHTEPTP